MLQKAVDFRFRTSSDPTREESWLTWEGVNNLRINIKYTLIQSSESNLVSFLEHKAQYIVRWCFTQACIYI